MRGLLRRWARSQRLLALLAILLITGMVASPLLTVNNHVQAYSTMAPVLRTPRQEISHVDIGDTSSTSGAGLQILLSDGAEQVEAVEAVTTAPVTPLDEGEVQQVLDRLPPLDNRSYRCGRFPPA